MKRIPAAAAEAASALALVETLQKRFASALEQVARGFGLFDAFVPVEWLRDEGRHGGGVRHVVADTPVYGRASINVSQVHYDDEPERALSSATALSAIVHPQNPHAPSMHMHISWTQLRDRPGVWRIMADLNPAIPEAADTEAFQGMLEAAAPELHTEAFAQGDRYFHIPALERHRGVCHFYLEGHRSEDADADAALARRVGESTIDQYAQIVRAALESHPQPDDAARQAQLAYHTVYLFQVLTLDRGTTSGLLVHDQNDVGILGSLPAEVDRDQLARWGATLGPVDKALVDAIVGALPDQTPSPVTTPAKRALARVVRAHYQAHPEALSRQASGGINPQTVDNHR
ncbi:MAG: coproporphyrinogen III oxidase [Deltaproteobacteria bacterium]|nr:coproporphyrinogen III oxidase [Deltaproteobacteria bacterium]